jgi:hypothetical protein
MTHPTAIWNGDNAAEIERLLSNHLARADKHGDKLTLIGIGLNVELNLGDTVLLDGDRLGIVRAGAGVAEDFVTWKGDNLPAIGEFVAPYGAWVLVEGERVSIYLGSQHIAALNRGDRIERKNGQMIVSRAGKDHRH